MGCKKRAKTQYDEQGLESHREAVHSARDCASAGFVDIVDFV